MRAYASPGAAIVAVGGVLLAGVYLVAVLDRLLGAIVAGGAPRWARLLAEPAQSAALLLLQQRRTTERPDAPAWALAPALFAGLAAVALAMVPLDGDLVVADPATGFVVFSAAIAMVMIAVYLHGWSPNSAFALHGAYRYGAQALSFQIPFLLAMLATAIPAQSLSIVDIVDAQEPLWNVIRQPAGLPLYLVVGVAVSFWGPLNLPDAADLAGGTSVEDAGVSRLLWKAARAAMLVAVAAMGAAVFLGGWWGPWLPGPAWVILKSVALLAVLVAATMTLGNLAALWQDDVRRLLGWSAVSQTGYGLMALVALERSDLAVPSLLFFLLAYVLGNTAAFGVVTELRGRSELAAYTGLARSRPWLAGALAIAFLSFIGIPPLAGFFAKLVLFGAAIEAGYTWLAVLAVVNTVISIAYYGRVLAPAYFGDRAIPVPVLGRWAAVATLASAAAVIVTGIAAEPFLRAFAEAALLPG